jgi:hypothetical protein
MDQIDGFIPSLIDRIKSSKAYHDGGLIVVTFDEAEVRKDLAPDDESDADTALDPDWADSCCSEQPAPGWTEPGLVPGHDGKESGGGRVGAILISRFIKPSGYDAHQYNHYSMLRSIEDLFGLSHLGYAKQSGLNTFQACGVFNNPSGT